jgi:16S rRNA (guanine(966)-N(2))-methyltransferase RsmD
MRVIGGTVKGHRLQAPRGQAVRPTADRVREALFSIIECHFALAGAAVLDLFAGTGAVGIEALSRGAETAVFVEQSRPALRVLRENLARCRLAERATVLAMPVADALRRLARAGQRFDGVFIDPPYGRGLLDETLTELARLPLLAPGAWVMGERHEADCLAERYGDLRLTRTRRYGKTSLVLFCVSDADETEARE